MVSRKLCSKAVFFVMLFVFLTHGTAKGQAIDYAYVANSGSGSISVINTRTETYAKTITGVYAAEKIFVAPDGLTAYAQSSGTFGRRLVVLDTQTHTVKLTGFGGRTQAMAFSPDSRTLYIATHNPYQAYTGGQCRFGGGLQIYDGITFEHIECIDFSEKGPSIASVRPDGKYVYSDFYYDRVTKLDVSDTELFGRTRMSLPITAPSGYSYHALRGAAQAPDGIFLYVTGGSWVQNDWCPHCDWANYGYLYSINMATNQIVNTLSIGKSQLSEIAVTSDGAYACVIDWYYKSLYLIKLDDYSYRVVPLFETIKGVAISPDSRYAYVLMPNSDKVAAVNIASGETTQIMVGDYPFDMAVTPYGRHLYVTNKNSNTVSVIEIGTNVVNKTIPVGQSPQAIAMIPAGNNPPTVEAGADIEITSDTVNSTIVHGIATDLDGDPLEYRWLEGETEISGWQAVGPTGEAFLELGAISNLALETHLLTLEVSDGLATVRDMMTLIVENSAPRTVSTGAGTYQIDAPIVLGGEVSDFDGDQLSYEWLVDDAVKFSGLVQALPGAEPVKIDDYVLYGLELGVHTVVLRISDGFNSPITSSIIVEVTDSVAPTLAPVINTTMLWPPNHSMRDIQIRANASDNSGEHVILRAMVSSTESEDNLGDGDTSPDWTEPYINQEDGTISLQLRAERFGGGIGREYKILISAVDGSDNSSQVEVKVLVPHDKSGK